MENTERSASAEGGMPGRSEGTEPGLLKNY